MANFQEFLTKVLYDERYRWIGHLGFWLVMYANEIFGITGLIESDVEVEKVVYRMLINMVVVYMNLYLFIPRFLKKRQLYNYLIWSFASLVIGMYLSYYPFRIFIEWSDYLPYTLDYLANTLGILGAAVAFKIIKSNIENQAKINDLQRIKTDTELRFLKDQINPHFLFNNLNNIYVQSRKTPELVPESIMQLSELMRYQLYDAAKNSVPLTQEINFLKNYIAVEELRKEHLVADVKVSGDTNMVAVAPLIFLAFVENVFKHGDFSDPDNSILKVSWHVTRENIVFICQNSRSALIKNKPNGVGGIGLENVRRRLDIHYPDNYQLDTEETEKLYKVHLKIKLNN